MSKTPIQWRRFEKTACVGLSFHLCFWFYLLVCLFVWHVVSPNTMHTQIIQFKLWILFRHRMCWFAIRMPCLQASGGVKWKLLCTQHFYPPASQIVIHNRQRHRSLITVDAYKSMEEVGISKRHQQNLTLTFYCWITVSESHKNANFFVHLPPTGNVPCICSSSHVNGFYWQRTAIAPKAHHQISVWVFMRLWAIFQWKWHASIDLLLVNFMFFRSNK